MYYLVNWGRRVVLLAAVLLGMVPATVNGAGPALASASASASAFKQVAFASTYSYVPLLASRSVFPAKTEQYAEVLQTPAFTMQPGETRRVTDQLDVRIPSGDGSPELNNLLICFDQQGHEIDRVSTGTNYTGNGHAYQWNVSMLITPPAQNPAENYFCQIWTYASSPDTGYVMTVLAPTPGQTTYGTWLEVSSGNEAGAYMWPYPGNCPSNDSMDSCQYIGGPANPAAVDVFTSPTWSAGDDATNVDAVATFQITSCPSGTKACGPGEHGSAFNSDGVTWLDVDQLYPDGSVCQVSRAYSEETTGGQVLLSERYDISDQQHHRPLYYHVSAPVSQLCGGSRTFKVDLHFQWTADNPVKLNGGNVNVINSVRATTTTVPNVTGSTQAQADAAIRAAGLTVAAPDYVTATAHPGTVLSQNAPGGTIEPAGSPVQLTVSLGQTTVPDVIGDRPAAAVQVIRKAGLTPVTLSPISTCVNSGTVQYQDPPGGAKAPPNSQVDIRIAACTR